MKKISFFSLIIGVFLAGIVFAMHDGNSQVTVDKGNRMNSSPTFVRFGDPKDSDLKGPGTSVDNHPSGARFYQHDWMRGNLGTVEFEHGKHSFIIDNVLSAIGSADTDVPGGIYQWSINFGVSPEQADTHEAAMARMAKLFRDLRAKGWTRCIDVGDPRLTGKQAWDRLRVDSVYSLDPDYTPTIDEWKVAIRKMPHWVFYADGVYLDVSLTESNMGGFVGKTTYLLTMDIKNEYAFYGLGYFPGNADKIRNWKTLLPAELQKYHAKRLATEAELKAQGYTIDTAYQDPPIKALQGSSTNP
ncbi:hypothetical protein NUV25_14730 [Burkholderia pseudomultivorans]|uniref:hypothetical protein n=1 Tax=Burkholderia pseudomultivorans TaxID=1207504 RepID=UPI002875E028|nr:hypothetical protein [Burkholderia pseudomultivorans]MDS0858963.1 hypothetical protein [Burkholderia pseudomultivorans]